MAEGVDSGVVAGFGDEWTRFNQSGRSEEDLRTSFESYFALFPWEMVGAGSRGFDLGCGSGRWARFVAPKVGSLACIDPSEQALTVARKSLAELTNVEFFEAAAGELPFADATFDFGYSLGVVHHLQIR